MKPLDIRLLRHARAARSYIGLTTVTGLLLTALIVAQVLLVARILGPVVDGTEAWSDVAPWVGALAAVFAGRVAVLVAQERYAHRASQSVITELRGQVLDHAVAQGPRWLDGARSAEIVTLTTRGLDDLAPYFERYLPQLLLAAILTPATMLVLFLTDFWSGVILSIAIPLIPIFMWLVGVLTAQYSQKRLATMDRLGGQLMDLLAGLTTLKGLGREKGPGARVRALADAFNTATMGTLRVAFLSGAILEFFASISVALVAVVAGMRLVAGEMTLEVGLAAIMLAPEILMPLRQVGTHFHASADGIAAADAVFAILETPSPVRGTRPAPDLRRASIVLDDVSVTAPGRHLQAPSGLDLRIDPGTTTALVGPSGSGKSTTGLLLLGLLQPDTGTVRVDHADGSVPLAEIDPADWHRQITWVPQRPTILPGTLAQNVTGEFTTAPRVDETLGRAARDSGLADVVESLPHGWDTVVGHGGVGLSVGQRQRLALARALVSDAPFVLLDEPTAHLDAATEADVIGAVRALQEAGRTVVVIAHRAGVVRVADAVVEVLSAPTVEVA